MKKSVLIPKIKSLNEEYKDIIKKQNIIIIKPKPDSINQNLKDIINYRKNIALKFKYNKIKFKNKFNYNNAMTKSRSQILKSNNSIYNIYNDINSKKNYDMIYDYKSDEYHLNKKEYEDKLMITGMNNKKFKYNENNVIIEESTENEKNKDNKIKL